MSKEKKSKVSLQLEEKMLFRCNLGKIKMQALYIDERNNKKNEKIGPSPTKLLALSVLSCLAASFEFYLEKKALNLSDLEGRALVTIARNTNNFWRIQKIDIELQPKVDNPEIHKMLAQCKRAFEEYCIISESIREGIEINVNLEY